MIEIIKKQKVNSYKRRYLTFFFSVIILIIISGVLYFFLILDEREKFIVRTLVECSNQEYPTYLTSLNYGKETNALRDLCLPEYNSQKASLVLEIADISKYDTPYISKWLDSYNSEITQVEAEASITPSELVFQIENLGKAEMQIAELQKEIVADRTQCNSDYSFYPCTCTNLIETSDLMNILTPREQIQALLAPALSAASLKNFSNDYLGYGAYVPVDTLDYKDQFELGIDINRITKNEKIPSLVGIDAEGGIIQRLSWYKIESLRTLKELPQEEFCTTIASQANALKDIGVNWSLSPVVDVTSDASHWIYNRTIDAKVTIVQEVAARYVTCMSTNNVMTAAKHFPGHGSTKDDSHKTIPTVGKSWEEWTSYDRLPFQTLSDQKIPTIMIGHLIYPAISPETSSLSSYWMQEVLRIEMQYTGVIVTDDMNMLHPNSSQECASLIAQSINNGADIALFVHNKNCNIKEVTDILVQQGLISPEIISDRLDRIMDLKRSYFCNLETE